MRVFASILHDLKNVLNDNVILMARSFESGIHSKGSSLEVGGLGAGRRGGGRKGARERYRGLSYGVGL